jgi:hypothetical protein
MEQLRFQIKLILLINWLWDGEVILEDGFETAIELQGYFKSGRQETVKEPKSEKEMWW